MKEYIRSWKMKQTPGHTPTDEELIRYIQRLGSLGQLEHRRFGSSPVQSHIVIGLILILGGLGIAALVML